MDFVRKIGVGIVMIVPGFAFGAMVWVLFESWLAVLGLEIVMVLIYAMIISGKFVSAESK